MEDQYGIAITNKFSLFDGDDESDPLDIIKQQQHEADRLKSLQGSKKTKSVETKNKSNKNQNLKTAGDNSETIKKSTDVKKAGGVSKKENLPNGKLANSVIRPKSADLRIKPEKVILSLQNSQVAADDSVLEPNETLITENDLEGFKEKLSRSSRQKQDSDAQQSKLKENLNSSSQSGGMRGRGSGFRRGTGRGRGGFDRSSRREFERHSGNEKSSVKGVEKKDGAGSHNWGSTAEVIEDQMSAKTTKEDLNNEESKDDTVQQPKTGDTESPAPTAGKIEQEGQEEEAKEMTLDEWKAIEESKRIKAEFNLRKAGEGCSDDAKWKKMIPLKKKEKDEEEKDLHNEEEDEMDESHAKKQLLPIEIKFNSDVGAGRGSGRTKGRGGRGGEAGGRGGARKQQQQQQKQQPTPNVDDEKDFPSLS